MTARLTPRNALFAIEPYRYAGTWVFDDASRGLDKEPFVAGIPEIIDEVVGRDANRFRCVFSDAPFPGHEIVLWLVRSEYGGTWYRAEIRGTPMEGWLCPALLKYFPEPPGSIYVAFTVLPSA